MKPIVMRLFVLVSVSVSSLAVMASSLDVTAELVDYGVINVAKKGWAGLAAGSSEHVDAVDVESTLEQTSQVRLGLGVNFGIKFLVSGDNVGDEIRVLVKGTHPPIRSPRSATTKSEYQYQATVVIGQLGYAGYEFNRSEEMVEGEWEIQVWYENRLLCSQAFQLYRD